MSQLCTRGLTPHICELTILCTRGLTQVQYQASIKATMHNITISYKRKYYTEMCSIGTKAEDTKFQKRLQHTGNAIARSEDKFRDSCFHAKVYMCGLIVLHV